MFKALLWKEWRETRLFIFFMVTGAILISLMLSVLEHSNRIKFDAFAVIYHMILIFFSALLAANQFSSEAESDTLEYLLSRPVHLFKIWLSKVAYGTGALILFSLFLLLMSMIFISPLLESVTLFDIFFENSTNYNEYTNCRGALLFLSIVGLYFLGCTISINIKSSFKSALITFLAAGCLYIILLCSYPEYYFKSSQYLLWVIFPIILFVIFIKHQPESVLTRIAFWVLPIGGILIWVVISFKGGSFLVLTANSYYRGFTNPLDILYFPVLTGICISSISTSLFAMGILPRGYPAWWKSVGCWNILTVLAICLSAFFMMSTPAEQSISSIYQPYQPYYRRDRDNANLPFVIQSSYNIKRSALSVYQYPYNPVRRLVASEQHFVLDRDKGEIVFYGRANVLKGDFQRVSDENRWVIYSCPALSWGTYYKLGLWAENLETSEQFLLMTTDRNNAFTGEWFDEGKRFVLLNYNRYSDKQSLLLFSFTNEEPEISNEKQISGNYKLIYIDKMNRLYFHDTGNNLVDCYDRDLVKEYNTTVIQNKIKELESEFKHIDSWRVYTWNPTVSPSGDYMFFSIRGYNQNWNTENKKRTRISKYQFWKTSLPNGDSKKFNDAIFTNYYYRWRGIPWYPIKDSIMVQPIISKSGDRELHLIDFKKDTTKTILREKSKVKPETFYFEWSGSGEYFLTYISNEDAGGMTVKLYSFDSETHSVNHISSEAESINLGSHTWSAKRSHVAFNAEDGKEIWVLDLTREKWSKIKSPFDSYVLMGVSSKGDVFVRPAGKIQVYRLTENEMETIIQRN